MERAAVTATQRGGHTRIGGASAARLGNSRPVGPERSGCVSVRYIHKQTLLAAYQTTAVARRVPVATAPGQVDNTDAPPEHVQPSFPVAASLPAASRAVTT